jgi:outer membrane protein TolC
MKCVAALAFVSLSLASSVAAQSAPTLTLEQAVDEALTQNDRLLDQRDLGAQAELGVRVARNQFQPKVTPNVLGSFGQTNVSSQTYRVDLSQRFTTGTEVRLGVGTSTAQIPAQPGVPGGDIYFYNADTTLTLSQPLLRGFGPAVARRSLTSAELRRADATRQRTAAEQQVTVDVAAAYYRVVAQQAFVAVVRASVERSRKLREASEAKLTAGLVSQLDLLRAQELVTQAELQLFDAQAMVEDGRDQLLFLMGKASGEPFTVVTEIPSPVDAPIDVDRAVALALENRLDLQSRRAERTDADASVKYSRNQLLPQVDVNFALTRRQTANSFARSIGLDGFEFATFFTIGMPVDRTSQQVAYQNAVIERGRRARELTTLERQIADDARRVLRDRERLLRNVAAAQTSVDIGRRGVEVAQLRYERGLSNNLDVVTAESGLLAAESRRIQALADAAVARLRVRAVLGILNPRVDIETAVEPASIRATFP